MTLLLFHKDTGHPMTNHKINKTSYLTYILFDSNNKGIFFNCNTVRKSALIFFIRGKPGELWPFTCCPLSRKVEDSKWQSFENYHKLNTLFSLGLGES